MKVSNTKRIYNICILTMGLFVGSVLSDAQVDPKVCPLEIEDLPSIVFTLNSEAAECDPNRSTQQRRMVSEATTPEEIRAAFKQVCDQRPTFTACLAAVKADTDLCLEGVERIKLLLKLGLLQIRFDVDCEQEGERRSVIEQEIRKNSGLFPSERDIINNCTWTGIYKAMEGWRPNPNIVNNQMAFEYRKAVTTAACLEEHRGRELDTLVNAGVAQWAEQVDRLMCWNEQDDKEVLCKTMELYLQEV